MSAGGVYWKFGSNLDETELARARAFCRNHNEWNTLSHRNIGPPLVGELWVVYLDDTIVGVTGCKIVDTCYSDSFTVVHRDHRREGWGIKLLKMKEIWVAHNTNVKFLVLVSANGVMTSLAQKLGYTLSGTVQGNRRKMKICVKQVKR